MDYSPGQSSRVKPVLYRNMRGDAAICFDPEAPIPVTDALEYCRADDILQMQTICRVCDC